MNNVLDSENFSNQGRRYYLDILQAKSTKPYLKITRIDLHKNEPAQRKNVIFFEDDFFFLAEGIAMLLGRYTSGQLGQNT